MSGKKLSKKARESLEGPSAEMAVIGNMDLITAAHNLLKNLGYEEIEIMDLLSTAHFLAGGDG